MPFWVGLRQDLINSVGEVGAIHANESFQILQFVFMG
jgi:hypothetical protein